MTPERWKTLQNLYHEASERDSGEREAYLRDACGDDAELLAEALALLQGEGAGESLHGVVGRAAQGVVGAEPRLQGRIGAYRILREIGHGGMGRVVLAERDDDVYHQQVAIKLLRTSVISEEAIRLFEAERQTLAQLSHPNIAVLLDGGTADDGTPYVVMQYIDGKRLSEYANDKALSIAGRLVLFLKICAAVSHAHRNLIVHRDIKPSNILVDQDGEPKLLDFGIAKILDAQSGAAAVTRAGVMTPAYASPEQVDGQPITIATDVYSLGAVLYELLTGQPPFQLTNTSPSEVAGIIRSTVPPPPSAALTLKSISASDLRGDLDNIVQMAMRKEPERRYADVSALAGDLRRYLEGRPVAARRDTLAYRAQKFVTRNAAMVAVVTLASLTLIAGAAYYTLQLQVERDRALAAETEALAAATLAERRAETANRVSDFLVGLFESSDVRASGRRDLAARDLLDAGYREIGPELQDEPGIKSHLLRVMGLAYAHMGAFTEAIPLLEESLALKRVDPDSSELDVAEALNRLAEVLRQQGNLERASELHEQAIVIREALSNGPSWGLGDSYNNFGLLQYSMGRYVRAEEFLRKAIDTHRDAHDRKLRSVGISLHNLALVQRQLGHYETALQTMNEALAVIEQAGFGDTAVHAVSLELKMRIHNSLNDFASAARTLEQSLTISRRVFEADNPRMAAIRDRTGTMHCALGEFEAALQRYDEGLAIYATTHGSDSWNYAFIQRNKGDCLLAAGNPAAAEALLAQSLETRRRLFGDAHVHTGLAEVSLAASWLDQGRTEGVREMLDHALLTLEASFDADHPEVLRARLGLARLDAVEGHGDDAAQAMEAIIDSLSKRPPGPLLAMTLEALGDVQGGNGSAIEARESRRRAADVRAAYRRQ